MDDFSNSLSGSWRPRSSTAPRGDGPVFARAAFCQSRWGPGGARCFSVTQSHSGSHWPRSVCSDYGSVTKRLLSSPVAKADGSTSCHGMDCALSPSAAQLGGQCSLSSLRVLHGEVLWTGMPSILFVTLPRTVSGGQPGDSSVVAARHTGRRLAASGGVAPARPL